MVAVGTIEYLPEEWNRKKYVYIFFSCIPIKTNPISRFNIIFFSFQVQVIPWALNDSNYVVNSQKLDPSKTVFVGALHGMINAQFLFKVFNEMFGGVIYAGKNFIKFN